MLSGKTVEAKSLHKVTIAAIDRHQVRNTILRDFETMKIHIRRPKTPEVCRTKAIDLRLIKAGKKGCSFTHRVWNGDRTAAHFKLRSSIRKWTYQESTKCEMRSRDLKKGMGAVGTAKTGTEGTVEIGTVGMVEIGAIGVAGGAAENMPMSVATPGPSKVSTNRETGIRMKRETIAKE